LHIAFAVGWLGGSNIGSDIASGADTHWSGGEALLAWVKLPYEEAISRWRMLTKTADRERTADGTDRGRRASP
jgi:hypothetical protein